MRKYLAFILVVFAMPVAAVTPVPAGKGSFVFTDAKGRPERPLTVYTYRPAQCDASCPIVFSMHGRKREGRTARDNFVAAADRHGLIVLAPEFSDAAWPRSNTYNQGDVRDQPDPRKWSYAAIEHLFDEVRTDQKDYVIFGHSAGAQFAHRLALLVPDNRAAVVVAANAGWYLMPEWRKEKAAFPYPHAMVGMPAGTPQAEAALRRALQRRLVVLLGEEDSDPQSADLDQAPGSRQQGANRFERGRNFVKAAAASARDLGVSSAWTHAEIPGVGHDSTSMARAAAEYLWGAGK